MINPDNLKLLDDRINNMRATSRVLEFTCQEMIGVIFDEPEQIKLGLSQLFSFQQHQATRILFSIQNLLNMGEVSKGVKKPVKDDGGGL